MSGFVQLYTARLPDGHDALYGLDEHGNVWAILRTCGYTIPADDASVELIMWDCDSAE